MPHDRKPKRKRKVEVKFDEKARSEYLTGFRKRKQARQLKAQNDIEKKLKQKVREERNRKRKATKEKREEILKGVTSILDNLNDDVTDTHIEKVDFAEHEVFVKSDINFADSGFLGNNSSIDNEREKQSVVKENGNQGNDNKRRPANSMAKVKKKKKKK